MTCRQRVLMELVVWQILWVLRKRWLLCCMPLPNPMLGCQICSYTSHSRGPVEDVGSSRRSIPTKKGSMGPGSAIDRDTAS